MVARAGSQRNADASEPLITIVMAYYENPLMLELQWKTLSSYSASTLSKIEIIVVDDASPVAPASGVLRPSNLPNLSIFRIHTDIRWNQDAARNIGAYEASAPWLLLTDIDHLVPESSLLALFELEKRDDVFYSFGRTKYENDDPRPVHPNSYFMAKTLYWSIGGHDEDFAGIYGKDFLFRKRAQAQSSEVHLPHVLISRVGAASVPDAGTLTISRGNAPHLRAWGYLLEWLKAARLWRGVQALNHPYERVV